MDMYAGTRYIRGDPYHVGDRTLIPVVRRTCLSCRGSTMTSYVPVALYICENGIEYLYLLEGTPEKPGDHEYIDEIYAVIKMD